MHRILSLLGAAVLLTACTTITIGEAEVFRPKPSVTPQTFDLDGRVLHDTSVAVVDSVHLNAWHLTQPDAEATVLFFGGNGFYLVQSRSYLRALTRPSTNAFLWDYRGYGQSHGEPSVDAMREDALAVYDHVVDAEGVDPDRLVLWGHSLGTFLATHVATERAAAGVVLENPATDVDDWVGHLFPWVARLFLDVDVDPALREQSNLERIRALQAPLLVIAGKQDDVTNPEMARDLHEAAGSREKTLVVVEEGEHNGLHTEPDVQAAFQSLIERIPKGRD